MRYHIAEQLAHISEQLAANKEQAPTVEEIASQAQAFVPGCDVASLTLRRRGRWETLGSTDPLADDADALQYALSEGPCLDAARDDPVWVSNRLGSDPRWPRWGPEAETLGIRSVVSIRLRGPDQVYGSLNLYGREEESFDHEGRDLAAIFGVHAAIALHASTQITGLENALTSRHRIGLAQGMLMERYGLSEVTSFEALKRLSSHTNRPLRDIAHDVVATGRLPSDPVVDPVADPVAVDAVDEAVAEARSSTPRPPGGPPETDAAGARAEESAARARAAAEHVLRLADEAHQQARDSHLRATELHRRTGGTSDPGAPGRTGRAAQG